jgi:cytochrome c oxidase cbb3-type subunit 3
MMRRLGWTGFAVLAASACGRTPTDNTEAASAPTGLHAVGPVPGPGGKPPPKPNPYAGDDAALEQGRQLFVRFNCSGCHGGRAGGGMGPSLRDVDWIYGKSADDIFDSIASGRANGMPAWGSKVPAPEIWKLVSYVQSLRTGKEPQPPS